MNGVRDRRYAPTAPSPMRTLRCAAYGESSKELPAISVENQLIDRSSKARDGLVRRVFLVAVSVERRIRDWTFGAAGRRQNRQTDKGASQQGFCSFNSFHRIRRNQKIVRVTASLSGSRGQPFCCAVRSPPPCWPGRVRQQRHRLAKGL